MRRSECFRPRDRPQRRRGHRVLAARQKRQTGVRDRSERALQQRRVPFGRSHLPVQRAADRTVSRGLGHRQSQSGRCRLRREQRLR